MSECEDFKTGCPDCGVMVECRHKPHLTMTEIMLNDLEAAKRNRERVEAYRVHTAVQECLDTITKALVEAGHIEAVGVIREALEPDDE